MLIELHTPDDKPIWFNTVTIQRVTKNEENQTVVWPGNGEYIGYSVIEEPEAISEMMRKSITFGIWRNKEW